MYDNTMYNNQQEKGKAKAAKTADDTIRSASDQFENTKNTAERNVQNAGREGQTVMDEARNKAKKAGLDIK